MIDDKFITVSFWDTAGADDYKKLRPLSYPQTDVFILAFSLVNLQSLVNLEKSWIPEIKKKCPNTPYILVGMQSYLRDENQKKGINVFSSTNGEEMKEKIGAKYYVECDSLNNYHLDEVIESAARCVSRLNLKQEASKKKRDSKFHFFAKKKKTRIQIHPHKKLVMLKKRKKQNQKSQQSLRKHNH